MRISVALSTLTAAIFSVACGASDNGGGSTGTGGATQGGAHSGGASSANGGSSSGGNTSKGGADAMTSSGGRGSTGGSPATTGGVSATGGAVSSGGTAPGNGGASSTGGAAAGGRQSGSGGQASAGGNSTTGGVTGSGGATARGGASSAGGGSGGSSGGSSGGVSGGTNGDAKKSEGCNKPPSLKNSTSTANQNTLTVSGASRQYLVRWPTNYDNTHPYRLILGFHGANGSDTDVAPSYFGLFSLSNNSTIFVAPSASGGIWNATTDLAFVDEILKTVEADLCVDTSRVELEGFSQGGAMVALLACQRPGVFRAAVGHSRGGLTAPTSCQPIPYLGSLGLSDISGNSQATQTDAFAQWNGCTVSTMPLASTGSHVCTNYKNCPAADPVIFCSFDGPHTASPTDAGKSSSWMPQEVWSFLSQF